MKEEKKKTGLGIKVAVLILLIIICGLAIFMYWQRYSATVLVEADDFWVNQSHNATVSLLSQSSDSPITIESEIKAVDEEIKAQALPMADDLAPPSDTANWLYPAPIKEGKVVQIVLSVQRLLAWEDGVLLGNFLASTGKPRTPTKQGSYHVLTKLKMAYGAGDGDTWAMPYWIGFYVAGGTENGIHALPYINGYKEGWGSLGRPVSHGCVRIADANQEWLYNWVKVGTPVIVQWQPDSELRPFEN